MSVAYSDKAAYHAAAGIKIPLGQGHLNTKSKRGGPLIASKNPELFPPSLERSAKNQSELSLLKLPEISQ
jgi:hypothetical protein